MEKRDQRKQNANRSRVDSRSTNPHVSILPGCPDIEQVVLGMMMESSNDARAILEVVTVEMFILASHRVIGATIEGQLAERAPVDFMAICELLRKRNELEEVGGAYYLTLLVSTARAKYDVIYYASLIREKYFYRECYLRLGELAEAAVSESMEMEEINSELARQMKFLAELSMASKREVSWKEAVRQSMEAYHRRKELAVQGELAGHSSGLVQLDGLTGGFQKGENVILCARPSMGKTAFALHLAQQIGAKGKPVVIFSLEMIALQLTNRALLGASEVNAIEFKFGTLKAEEEGLLEQGALEIEGLPITLNDTPTLTVAQIHARCAALQREGRCEVVFVDYLQLVGSSGARRNGNREQEVAEVSRGMKMLALDLKITVVLLSQLNRQAEGRVDKKPQLHDLRDSGSIEQDADIVIALHRDHYYNPLPENEGIGSALVLKNRNGATGSVTFTHNPSMTRIGDERGPGAVR